MCFKFFVCWLLLRSVLILQHRMSSNSQKSASVYLLIPVLGLKVYNSLVFSLNRAQDNPPCWGWRSHVLSSRTGSMQLLIENRIVYGQVSRREAMALREVPEAVLKQVFPNLHCPVVFLPARLNFFPGQHFKRTGSNRRPGKCCSLRPDPRMIL